MDKFIELLKINIGFCVGLYLCLGITTWAVNGYYGLHYSISDLNSIFGFAFAKLSVDHGINSVFNSNKGEMPSVSTGGVKP